MSGKFQPINRDTVYLLPPSLQYWLPEKHLARFVIDSVDQLDLSELVKCYGGGGKQPYHPALLLALLFYGYATGVFSCRELEQATYDSVALRFITGDAQPDHDPIAIPWDARFTSPLVLEMPMLSRR
jgi:transposase